ncbi:hypothetical protein [Helicobacter sp. T3_23-1056]
MGIFDIAKKVGNEVYKHAKEYVDENAQCKERYENASDEELISRLRIGSMSAENVAILSVLKSRGYDNETIKELKGC